MTTTIFRILFFSVLLQISTVIQLKPADAADITDFFIFPANNAKSIYCSELQLKNNRIQCTSNAILMEFDKKDISMIEVIHNGQSLRISHFDEKTMDTIETFVSKPSTSANDNKTADLITKSHILPFIEKAAAFQKKVSLETAFGKATTALLLLGMAGIATGSLLFTVAAFRAGMFWGLGCVFIPFIPLIFLFVHWNSARKPFVISIFGLLIASAALFLINKGEQNFIIKKDTGHYNFQCRGKTYCSEMSSCAEAKFYLLNCPGTKIDGDHDGIPCEKQWCN